MNYLRKQHVKYKGFAYLCSVLSKLPKLDGFVIFGLGKNWVFAFDTPLQCLALKKGQEVIQEPRVWNISTWCLRRSTVNSPDWMPGGFGWRGSFSTSSVESN